MKEKLTEKLGFWGHQTSAEAGRTYVQESTQLRSSLSTWLSKTLPTTQENN